LKVDGDQALILKVDALTNTEMGTESANVPFLSIKAQGALSAETRAAYYFDEDGSNGYQDSGLAAGYGLKAAIDYYYAHTLINYESKILTVNLHDPDLATFNRENNLSWEYNGAPWADFYKDTHFASTVDPIDGSQQAFALSYGDINSTMGIGEIDLGDARIPYSALLDFSSGGDDVFWLRSTASMEEFQYTPVVGAVYNGIPLFTLVPSSPYCSVRPALWVKLS
ncbi:MAG: hypothetical protein LBS33_08610, partial [Streptococcaceae bacterium]|nr:hypothetical protein [Streptococcaceae bacterium]